jgi:hypothetical protein
LLLLFPHDCQHIEGTTPQFKVVADTPQFIQVEETNPEPEKIIHIPTHSIDAHKISFKSPTSSSSDELQLKKNQLSTSTPS